MKMIGIDNIANDRHFDIPIKFIRYSVVETRNDVAKFYVKSLGFKDRIEVTQETYKLVIDVLEEYNNERTS